MRANHQADVVRSDTIYPPAPACKGHKAVESTKGIPIGIPMGTPVGMPMVIPMGVNIGIPWGTPVGMPMFLSMGIQQPFTFSGGGAVKTLEAK